MCSQPCEGSSSPMPTDIQHLMRCGFRVTLLCISVLSAPRSSMALPRFDPIFVVFTPTSARSYAHFVVKALLAYLTSRGTEMCMAERRRSFDLRDCRGIRPRVQLLRPVQVWTKMIIPLQSLHWKPVTWMRSSMTKRYGCGIAPMNVIDSWACKLKRSFGLW